VGAVKSCIGHLEACAGLAGIVKAIECLERGKIPPQMHFNKPNPAIDSLRVKIPTEMTDWPNHPDQPRRAAINTFGAGGTNAHAVLENYSANGNIFPDVRKTFLYMVSAADDSALQRMASKYAAHVETHKPSPFELAHTVLTRRSILARSIFFSAGSHEEIIRKLKSQSLVAHATPTTSRPKPVIFLFTGQGAQWYVYI
jgi:acyl transferase domain-containing protein